MYPWLRKLLPHRPAILVTALSYTALLSLIFMLWNLAQGDFRYLHV